MRRGDTETRPEDNSRTQGCYLGPTDEVLSLNHDRRAYRTECWEFAWDDCKTRCLDVCWQILSGGRWCADASEMDRGSLRGPGSSVRAKYAPSSLYLMRAGCRGLMFGGGPDVACFGRRLRASPVTRKHMTSVCSPCYKARWLTAVLSAPGANVSKNISTARFAAPMRFLLRVLAPKPESPTDEEYGSDAGNPVGWDGSAEGLEQMRRMMPECNIICGCAENARKDEGSAGHSSFVERPAIKIEHSGGKVDFVEAGLLPAGHR
jgi:hypothetical protein